MFIENETYKCDCIDLDSEGNGVCKIDDFIFFVKGPLKGERVSIKVDKVNKNFGLATLKDIYLKSPYRVKPECPYYEQCGGCNLMHFNYYMHSNYKKYVVKDLLNRIGKVDTLVNDTIFMSDPLHYRNNVQVSFSNDNGVIKAGFYAKKTHNVIDMDTCIIAPQIANRIVVFLKRLFTVNKISIYNPKTKKGCIKHVIIRANKKSDVMLCFVTNTKELEKRELLVSEIVKKFPKVVSILHNINIGVTPIHLGNKTNLLYGTNYLTSTIFNTKFEIGLSSFYQVNTTQMEKLYSKVFEYLNLNKDMTLIDAYCGIGTMGLIASKHCKEVYGIEVVDEAIYNANRNKVLNNINNATFILGKAEDEIERLVNNKKIDALIVDPPRKGCEESFLKAIVGIEKIVYVSCNPSTLARDLKFLKEYYDIVEVTPVDMFPFSNHVETVCLLLRKTYQL
ncbi:MAG: 23S rRNA (uracil(1939)-C(5))-methyltransferase RlmD [bacterium]|nr:23S rRNA (uracil(1939)-C(5))-methyltransferase RlmD [bacterium]